jgi:excisionase family DNA binding protein
MLHGGAAMTSVEIRLDDRDIDRLADLLAERVAERIVAQRSPWLDAHEAADYLRCSLSRVRKLTMLAEVPSHRDGGRVLYRRDELDQYVAAGGASSGR